MIKLLMSRLRIEWPAWLIVSFFALLPFRRLSEINHPNLVGMQTLEVDGSQWFFTMELVEGTSFIEYVRADIRPSPSSAFVGCGARELERLRKTLPQLAAAVYALHTADLVHRDLHPGNVRVTFGGRVVVIDYGLTIVTGATPASALIGTAAYMAPEQAAGIAADRRADVWAFGVVLWEMLTGSRPFADEQLVGSWSVQLGQRN